jgi:drug/metabolite transporter (DMT)-like permease
MKSKTWLLFALTTTIFWGIWGAFIEIPEKSGFPATLGYTVWALTMIPCALVALAIIRWKPETDRKSIFLGSVIGLLGAGGQLILFEALRSGPAYIVFPFISLFPVVTIFLSILFLKERAGMRQWAGIILALIAIFFLSYQKADGSAISGYAWLFMSMLVFLMWGIQAWVMKYANETMKAESIFMYMAITALVLIPVAIWMTDFSHPINWGFRGPYLAAMVHVLNSIGALTIVYALRRGKAMIVVPMTGLSPVITVGISLLIYSVIPGLSLTFGIAIAIVAIYLLSV